MENRKINGGYKSYNDETAFAPLCGYGSIDRIYAMFWREQM